MSCQLVGSLSVFLVRHISPLHDSRLSVCKQCSWDLEWPRLFPLSRPAEDLISGLLFLPRKDSRLLRLGLLAGITRPGCSELSEAESVIGSISSVR